MSLYFEKRIQPPIVSGGGVRINVNIEWHKIHPLLAISNLDEKRGGVVSIYDHTKEESIDVDSAPSQHIQVASMAWHPTQKYIAIGYELGEVIVWNHEEGEIFEGSKAHATPVMLLQWSDCGTILISTDNMGCLVVWKSDSQGHIQNTALHDFKDPVCEIVFRRKGNSAKNDDKDRTLGLMTSWRPKTGQRRNPTRRNALNPELSKENALFVGLLSGGIYYVKESGSSEEVLTAGCAVKSLLYHPVKEILVVMTDAMIMGQFSVDPSGNLAEVNKMKISGNGEVRLCWIGSTTLGVLSEEPFLRLWDVDTNDNVILEPKGYEPHPEESFLTVDYNKKTGILCACTSRGKLVMWRETSLNEVTGSSLTEEDHWEWCHTTSIPMTSKSARWCHNLQGVLAVNAVRDVLIFWEQELCFCVGDQLCVVQTLAQQAAVQIHEDKLNFDIKTDLQISGICASKTHIVFWSGNRISTYEVGPNVPSNYRIAGTFILKCDNVRLFEQSIFTLEKDQIQIRTFQGTIKQSLSSVNNEGTPITLQIGGEYLTVATANAFLKIWHVARREAKQHVPTKNLNENVDNLGEVIQANTNNSGTHVAFTVAQYNLMPDSRFFLWDLSNGKILEVEFPGRFAVNFFWDKHNPLFIVAETKLIPKEIHGLGLISSSATSYGDTFETDVDSGERRFLGRTRLTDELREFKNSQSRERETSPTATTLHVPSSSQDGEMVEPESIIDRFIEEWKHAGKSQTLNSEPDESGQIVVTMFADPNRGFLIHERRDVEIEYDRLIGMDVPYLFFTMYHGPGRKKKPKLKDITKSGLKGKPQIKIGYDGDGDRKSNKKSDDTTADDKLAEISKVTIEKAIIKDFEGIEEEEEAGRTALINYVHCNLMGDIEGALKFMRVIKSNKIYKNMAKSCVKTKRVDIALICLARMNNCRAAREVRISKEKESSIEPVVAMLALQLGMNDEAEAIYIECERYDLLLNLYIALRKWDKAIALCEKKIRIRLRTTYHLYGKFLEEEKRFKEAITMYEKAETHRYEVPRMLVEDPTYLESYINQKQDKELYQWWAQYMESTGEIDTALQYYGLAKDWLSLVRLLCFCGDHEKAVECAEKVNDPASSYHLARTLEDKGENDKAIRFYSKAGAFGNAIRICKDNQMNDTLWSLALQALPAEMADAAKYYESKADQPDYDKAIQLYHKAGYTSRALDLAFSMQEFGALQMVAKDILSIEGQQTDPVLLQKCADFFVENQQIDKAIDMLAAAKKYTEAMDLCVKYHFTISEELSERLTAPKGVGLDEQTRIGLLEKMGECCMLQGDYHLSAKKYTQAGQKGMAMKSLLKSGDTERIIFYANVCRQRDIYMMAANYLQTIDFRKSSKIVEKIESFYKKAKAEESLAGFYEVAAQIEIDEDHDYRKALYELRKAEKTWSEVIEHGTAHHTTSLHVVQTKCHYIQRFLSIRENFRNDPDHGILELKKFLEEPNFNSSGVNKGDIYSIMVEHYTINGQHRVALQIVEEMKNVLGYQNTSKFLKPSTIQAIETALNIGSIFRGGSGNNVRKSIPNSSSMNSLEETLPYLQTNRISSGNNANNPYVNVNGNYEDDDEADIEGEELLEDEELVEEEIEDEDVEDEEVTDGEDEVLDQTPGFYKAPNFYR